MYFLSYAKIWGANKIPAESKAEVLRNERLLVIKIYIWLCKYNTITILNNKPFKFVKKAMALTM